MTNFKNGVFVSYLCNCKFENELNDYKFDVMYSMINKRVKQSTNKLKDKDYLMIMEDLFKTEYEYCKCCRGRYYNDKLIEATRPLQQNFKNVKFNKFRKSPRHNDNMIINFLYNICYDGVKHLHYPVFLLSS